MLSDLKYVLFWWLTIFLLGGLSLPLVFHFFKSFWDKGYIFSKIISLSLFTYITLVLGIFKFLPFSSSSIFSLIVFSLFINFYYLSRPGNWPKFLDTLKTHYKAFLFEEIIFLLLLVAWSFVRGFAPDIEGLEKFMDWGFVNSMLRSQFMPPADVWFSGESINYYYFGHLMFAFLTKLSGISSVITYNLSIATVCGLTFVSGFSIVSNLVRSTLKKPTSRQFILPAIISALLLTFGGNLHAIYKITKLNIQQNNNRLVLTKPALTQAMNNYWYPDATRFIGFDPDIKDKTIHEFPVYSFVVADLHGHMNDIPVILLFMAFLFSFYLSLNSKNPKFPNWSLIIPSGLLLSIAYMTNAWDYAVYGMLFGISYFFINLTSKSYTLRSTLWRTFASGTLAILFWLLFSLPFSLNFTPMTEGLRLADSRTPLYQLFVLYGGFWLIGGPFFLYILIKLFKFLFKKAKFDLTISDVFVFSLFLTATVLVIIPEIGYIKDIYIYEHRRANTMFKLVYEAFIMYSLVSGYALFRFSQKFKKFKAVNLYRLVFLLVFVSHMIYPYFAIKSYYGLTQYKGLWGLGFLELSYPDNLSAINWINKNIQGQPVILEATGDSYTTFNQISMATGLPTVEGWVVHEWLWRGGYDKPGARQTEVEKMYTSADKSEVASLLQKYSVKYVFVGDKEREKYPDLNEKNFTDLGAKIIFQSGLTKVYQL